MATGLGINATEDSAEEIFTRAFCYTVPDYQRQYSWGEEQWAAMWADINSIEKERTHFMGSLVVIQRSTSINEPNQLEIVDGQQRLATLSIILAVMREKYYKEGCDKKAKEIEDRYLKYKPLSGDAVHNLTLSQFDRSDFEKIVEGKYEQMRDGQLKEAVDFFASKLESFSEDDLDILKVKLLGSVSMVSIECDGDESAFRLFETLNDRGKELSSVDLMKNYTFSQAVNSPEVDYNDVKEDWQNIVSNIVPNTNKPSRFFRHFIMSCDKPDYNNDVSNYTLYDEYKKIIQERLPEEDMSINDYVSKISHNSEVYLKILNKSVDMYDDDGNKAINSKLEDLEIIKSVQARPLILRVLLEFDTANRVMESLEMIEKFMLRWKVSSYPTGGELDRLLSGICSDAFDKANTPREIHGTLSDRCPSDEEFIASIENKRVPLNERTKYILRKLEEEYYNGTDVDLDDFDTEHIAPRASFTAKKYSAWPVYLSTTEAQFQQYRDKIGNLTLLESEKNISIGAGPFEKKKEAYSESQIKMTNIIASDYDDWGIDEIESRTSELAQAMVKVWDL